MPPQGPSPVLFFDTISAYQRTEALRTAIELDLFTPISAGQRTATEIATALQSFPARHSHPGGLSHHSRLSSQTRRAV